MFSPEQSTVDTVRAWLIDSGINPKRITHSDNKGWLAFDATTEEAEALLLTEYHLYEHEDGHTAPACERYERFNRRVSKLSAYDQLATTSPSTYRST